VLRACKADEILVYDEEERDLEPQQAQNRLDWKGALLAARPHSKNQNDIVFADEFHPGAGTEVTKRIKRRMGPRTDTRKRTCIASSPSTEEMNDLMPSAARNLRNRSCSVPGSTGRLNGQTRKNKIVPPSKSSLLRQPTRRKACVRAPR
jgi:hypothetical protein